MLHQVKSSFSQPRLLLNDEQPTFHWKSGREVKLADPSLIILMIQHRTRCSSEFEPTLRTGPCQMTSAFCVAKEMTSLRVLLLTHVTTGDNTLPPPQQSHSTCRYFFKKKSTITFNNGRRNYTPLWEETRLIATLMSSLGEDRPRIEPGWRCYELLLGVQSPSCSWKQQSARFLCR